VEQHVAATQVLHGAGVGQVLQLLGREITEEIDAGQQFGRVHHPER
jgi:hypothetical protein